MSIEERRAERGFTSIDAVAGLMASAALFLGVIAIAYRPVRLAPAAILLALVAGGMSRRTSALAAWAVLVAGIGWLLGMAIATVTNHPLW